MFDRSVVRELWRHGSSDHPIHRHRCLFKRDGRGSVSTHQGSVVQQQGKRERTDDELLDSELFHGVGWGRLLLGLSER